VAQMRSLSESEAAADAETDKSSSRTSDCFIFTYIDRQTDRHLFIQPARDTTVWCNNNNNNNNNNRFVQRRLVVTSEALAANNVSVS